MGMANARSLGAAGILAFASLATSGCFLSPGEFEANLDIRGNGDFRFSYDGQIHMLAVDDLAAMGENAEPDPCLDDEGEQRACTPAEIAEQQEQRRQQAEMMKAMMGGNRSADTSAEELASQLERQAGWNRVDYLGEGLFDVDFSIAGKLTYDFAFPTVEGFPSGSEFVTANLRDEGRVRIQAPGFSPAGSVPFGGAFAALMAMGAAQENGKEAENPLASRPMPKGTFAIVTDAEILANNTDEGPQAGAGGMILTWEIGPESTASPTALLGLDANFSQMR